MRSVFTAVIHLKRPLTASQRAALDAVLRGVISITADPVEPALSVQFDDQLTSLADIVRMVHPKPATPSREALYGHLLGKSVPYERLPGLAREFVNRIQSMRRDAGLEVTDRVRVTWAADGAAADALRAHAGHIADEVLAESVEEGEPAGDAVREWTVADETVTSGLERAGTSE